MRNAIRILAMAAAAVAVASCFDPSYQNTACSAAGDCPPGFTCDPATDTCKPEGVGIGDGDKDAPTPDATTVDAFSPPDAPPDAEPVGCTSNSQCQTPPSPCLQPGTCDTTTNECDFPPVDCSSMDSACTVGVCEAGTGTCVAQPAAEGDSCEAPTVENCGTCGNFNGECGEDGTQACTCTSFTCQSGACTASATSCDRPCSRSTTGNSCGAGQTIESCGSCSYSSTCDNTGSQNCTCTNFTCGGGTCNAGAPFTCPQACNRNTNGDTCGAGLGEVVTQGSCQYSSTCDERAETSGRTCRDNRCDSGTCNRGSTYACERSCSRNTDGNLCGARSCGTNRVIDLCCNSGACNVECGICECTTCVSEPAGEDQ